MAAKIEKYCAKGVYDTPSYSQAIKVTAAQTILFLGGQRGPASTMVQVASLSHPDYVIEVEALAVI